MSIIVNVVTVQHGVWLQEKFLAALMSGNFQLPPPHVLPFAAALSAAGALPGYPPAGLGGGSLPYPVFPLSLIHISEPTRPY